MTFYAPSATSMAAFAFVGSPWGLLAAWLLLINLFAFMLFGIDKWKAKHPSARRIRERSLLLTAILGGSIGAWLGMKVWHHKTLHRRFRYGIPAILIIQAVLAVGAFLYISIK